MLTFEDETPESKVQIPDMAEKKPMFAPALTETKRQPSPPSKPKQGEQRIAGFSKRRLVLYLYHMIAFIVISAVALTQISAYSTHKNLAVRKIM